MTGTVALVAADFTRIRRDSFLIFMLIYPWIFGLVIRWLFPIIETRVADRLQLSAYAPLAACLVAVLVPYCLGIVLGFQLLEEKEANCLAAVAVTPMSLGRYFGYRSGLYVLAGIPLLVGLHELVALVEVPLGSLLLVSVAAAPTVPLMALVIATFASNQVEGFAVMKGFGFLILLPLASFFLPGNWDLLVGILPTYWPIKAYFASVEGSVSVLVAAAVVAVVFQGWAVRLLYRRLSRRVLAQ